MKKNHDHVAVHRDQGAVYWELGVPSAAETCEEQTREMIELCEQFFQTFGEFLTPTEIEFHVPCFPAGHELPASMYDDAKIKMVQRKLQSSEGISVDEFLTATEISNCPSRWMPNIEFNGNSVLVELTNGPVVADRTNHTVEYKKKQPTNEPPDRDLLEIDLLHGPASSKSIIEAEFATYIIVDLNSDIWFEDSEIGRVNAQNLAAFLERIHDTLPVEEVNRTSDWYPVERLEEIY